MTERVEDLGPDCLCESYPCEHEAAIERYRDLARYIMERRVKARRGITERTSP